VPDTARLRTLLSEWTRDEPRRTEAGRQARALVQAGRGSTERVVALIKRLVAERSTTAAGRRASR